MAAVLLRPHDADAPHHAPTRLIAIVEEGGEAVALVVGGARHEDEMLGRAGAGDEPFAAADHPLASRPLGPRHDHARIRAAARRRLGHGERRLHLALDDRLEPTLLLRRRARPGAPVHVAGVRPPRAWRPR